jgi:hypothetical protein
LCDFFLYCSRSASQRVVARRSAGGVLSRPNSTKRDLVCAELIFSTAGADACNSLILREPLGLVAQFQRTFSWDVKYNPVTCLVSIAYLRNEHRNLGRSCEPLTNLQTGGLSRAFGISCLAFFEQRSSAQSSSCQHRHAPKTIYSLPRPPNCPSGCNSQPMAPYCHSPTGKQRPASRPTGRQTEPGVIPVCGGA